MNTPPLPESVEREIEEESDKVSIQMSNPVIRSMWPSTSRGEMKCFFKKVHQSGSYFGYSLAQKHYEAEIADLTVKLSACGVGAMMNTRTTAKQRINKDHEYWSVSYGDVCSAVDREMDLREKLEQSDSREKMLVEALQNTIDLYFDLKPEDRMYKNAKEGTSSINARAALTEYQKLKESKS